MNAINAYFDGTACIPLDDVSFKKNQHLIILQMDDFIDDSIKPTRKFGMAKGTLHYPNDIDFCNDEIAEMFGDNTNSSVADEFLALREEYADMFNDPIESYGIDNVFENIRNKNVTLRGTTETIF